MIELTQLQGRWVFLNIKFLGGINHRYKIIDYCWNSDNVLFIWIYYLPDFDIKWDAKSRCWENRSYKISDETQLCISVADFSIIRCNKRGKYEMTITNKKSNIDKRLNQRRSYSGHIFFVAKNGFNEGWLKDFSRSGLFIFTKARLSVGEIITVALPFLNGKKVKCKGQILRCTKEGFGIELFRNRSVVNLRIIK